MQMARLCGYVACIYCCVRKRLLHCDAEAGGVLRQVTGRPAARSVIIPMLQYRKTGLETLPEVHSGCGQGDEPQRVMQSSHTFWSGISALLHCVGITRQHLAAERGLNW